MLEARYLERALAHVVRLLGIERQDAMRHGLVGDDDRHDGLSAELPQGAQPVVAVRSPVSPVIGPHRDDGVEKAIQLVDRLGEPGHVRLRQVALVGCGLHLAQGQAREDLPVAAERVAVGAEHRAAIRHDRLLELLEGRRRRRNELLGAEAA